MDIGIIDLPAEIRTKIFKWLPQHIVVHTLRLVCKQWRDEIDNLCEFAIDLDDRKPHWERLLELRVRHCKIIHFLQPPPSGPGTTILKYVHVVRVLKISEHISPSNLYYLLGDCCKSLVSLRLAIGAYLLGFDWPSRFSSFNFQRLESLEINMSTMPTAGSSQSSPFLGSSDTKILEDLFLDLLSYRFRRLKSLKLSIRCWGFGQVSKFLSGVLVCVANHLATLTLLDMDLVLGHGLPTAEVRSVADADAARINFSELKIVKRLEVLRLISSSPVGITLLIDLLDQQTALKFLEVDIFPAPASLFSSVVLRNSCTLTNVEITDLVVWDDEGYCNPFNAEVFSSCSALKKLILDRNVTRRRIFDTAEIINLFSLPPGLEELALNYFNLLSDELLLFCASECGQALRTIYLTQCGSSGDFGVDGTVLEKIIEMPMVNFIEISTLNNSNLEERDKLNMILETFGYSEDHSYFQLTKRTQSVPIKFHAYFLDSEELSEEAFVDD